MTDNSETGRCEVREHVADDGVTERQFLSAQVYVPPTGEEGGDK